MSLTLSSLLTASVPPPRIDCCCGLLNLIKWNYYIKYNTKKVLFFLLFLSMDLIVIFDVHITWISAVFVVYCVCSMNCLAKLCIWNDFMLYFIYYNIFPSLRFHSECLLNINSLFSVHKQHPNINTENKEKNNK